MKLPSPAALVEASPSVVLALMLLIAAAMAAGCLPDGSGDPGTVDPIRIENNRGGNNGAQDHGADAGNGDTEVPQASCEGVDPVAGLAERCCTGFGVDACGPGLFCAAYDGRQFAACYVLHSREPGESCAADDECLSYRCNADTGRCAGVPNGPCDLIDGCGPGPSTDRFVCVGGTCKQSSGEDGSRCGQPSDCNSGICIEQTCAAGRAGDDCQNDSHCVSNICVSGRCTTGANGEPCADDGDCSGGGCVANQCRAGNEGDYCTSDSHCRSGLVCAANYCSAGEMGDECDDDSDCSSGQHCSNPCGGGDCQYTTTCTTGAEGSPCVTQDGCNGDLICDYGKAWPPGSFFSSLGTCVTEESCGFLQQYCSRPSDVCLRTSNGEFCGPPGSSPPGSSCTEDADCASGVCADYGDGVLQCSQVGGWGYPCWISNDSLYPGDEHGSGCAENHFCNADLGEDGIGKAYGTCGGGLYFVCSLVHDGTTIARYGGCADGGLSGCQPDPWGRKQCENDSSICETDADCGGARCVVVLYCR